MKLRNYFSQRGSLTRFSKDSGFFLSDLCAWANEKRRVPMKHCLKIEKATNGAVRCEDLRPDIDWGYLRTSQNQLNKERE